MNFFNTTVCIAGVSSVHINNHWRRGATSLTDVRWMGITI